MPFGQTKMQPPAPAPIYGGSEKDFIINPPHVDEQSLPGWQDLASGPGDAEARWLRFAKLNPKIDRDIREANSTMQRSDYDSGTEFLREYRDQQGRKKAVSSLYSGLILDTYFTYRAITVARYHAEHDARVKKWKITIAAIAVGAVAATFLGPAAGGAAKTAGGAAAAGSGGTGAAAAGSSLLTPITVAAKPLALIGGKVVTAGAAAAAAAPTASLLTPITVAAKPIALKAAAGAAASKILTPITVAAKPITAATIKAGAAAADASGITTAIQQTLPKVVSTVNAVRTVEAIAKGEVPPPPISLEGDSFTSWAGSVGRSVLEEKIRSKQADLTAAQAAQIERELDAEIRAIQTRAAAIAPRNLQPQPMPEAAAAVAAGANAPAFDWRTIALIGAPLLTALIMRG